MLRLEDPELVQAVHAVQQGLYAADFHCHLLGLGGPKARQGAGLELFDVEGVLGEGGDLEPRALVATRKLAESEEAVAMLCQLGAANGAGPRARGLRLLQPPPRSWPDFAARVLLLMKLALFAAAERHALQPEPSAGEAAPDDVWDLLEDSTDSRSKKRRSKRKQRISASSATGRLDIDGEHTGDFQAATGEVQESPASETAEDRGPCASAEPSSGSLAALELATEVAVQQVLRRSADSARVAAAVQPALCASQALRASASQARVDAELRARQARRSSFPPWLFDDPEFDVGMRRFHGEACADGAIDSAAAAMGGVTVIKNTFVEVIPAMQWRCRVSGA